MKKLITIIAAGAFAFIGTVTNAEARPYSSKGYQHQSKTYVSGYHHGRPVYTQKTFIGYNRYGKALYKYRTVSAPSRHRGNSKYSSRSSHGSSGLHISLGSRR